MADPQSPDDSAQSNSSVGIGDSAQAHVGGDVVGGSTYARDRFNITNSQVTIHPSVPPAPPPPLPNLIPLRSGSTYIKRGIEDIIIANLLGGMELAAIVSVRAPGGIGKTEMAKVVAARCETYFDAVKWVDCGPKTPEQIIADLAREIGHPFTPAANALQQRQELTLALARAKHLVIFDDVRRANQMLFQEWLPPRPCATLITSRLHHVSSKIPANSQFDLEGMDNQQARILLGSVLGTAAVQQETAATDRLVERCLGNPLALDIAARRILELQRARVSQPIERITRKVEARRAELRAGADPRHNLWAVFDISYDELSADEQARFRKLAACANSGFSVNLAAALWGTEPPQATTQLEQFAALSLVLPIDAPLDAGERFRLHDLLDDYALDKLQKAGEEKETRDAHAQWLIDLFGAHDMDDMSNAPHVFAELDNLRAAAHWAQDSRNGDLLARIATKPRNWLYNIFRVNSEWLAWLTQSLELGVSDQWMQANVRQAMGDVQQFRKDMNAALDSYNQALTLFQQVGDKLGEANVRQAMGDVRMQADDFAGALELYRQAQALYELIKDGYSTSRNLLFLANAGSGQVTSDRL